MRIEDIDDIDGMRRVKALEIEVWQLDPADALPVTMLVATRAAGAILTGAFEGEELVGFVYGFPGIEHGRTTIHSHMLAVRPEYRDHHLGTRLKLAQRDRALALGVTEITWTFDALQSRNAHFNFARLGILVDAYKLDFYGRESSSFLMSGITDRFWARWFVGSERVDRIVRGQVEPPDLSGAVTMLDVGPDGAPVRGDLDGDLVLVRVPPDINAVRREAPELDDAWREATRWAFAAALAAGFVVETFVKPPAGAYVLRRGRVEDFL